jgi:magnesium-transporting ATPase (P-type)
VVVRSSSGQLILMCKGADNVMFERLSANNPTVGIVTQHLRSFASEGLRTLVLAQRIISEDEYTAWSA